MLHISRATLLWHGYGYLIVDTIKIYIIILSRDAASFSNENKSLSHWIVLSRDLFEMLIHLDIICL